MKGSFLLVLPLSMTCLFSCLKSEETHLKVTSVTHTPVKRQSIGNCWLYAQATWLESMLKTTLNKNVNVSETYWTYWDMYHKLLANQPIPEEELNTGGSWQLSKSIIKKYGWVNEEDFIPEEKTLMMSEAQHCAETYLLNAGKEGGSLFDLNARTPELLRTELDKAFSCEGKFKFDMTKIYEKRQLADDTMLEDANTKETLSLSQWLDKWQEASVYGGNKWSSYEGKKLMTESEAQRYKNIEQRIKRALNDHQPVILSFFVSFNAPNEQGLFNIDTLAAKGDMGKTGGHMLVLNDYTVKNVPTLGPLGEGDLDDEMKALALEGDLDYLVVKNSWGRDRPDRPWLNDGYTRLSWDYLTSRYENEDHFSTFIRGLVFPPGY